MRRAVLLLLLLALAAPVALRAQTPAPSPTQSQNDSIEQEKAKQQEREQAELKAQKEKELEDIRRRAAASREAASQLRGQENKVLGELRRVERDLGVTRHRLKQLDARRASLDRELGRTRQSLVRSIQNLGDQRARLALRLRHMYMMGASRELEFLLSTRSFAELMARWDYLVLVAKQDRALLQGIETRKEQVEASQHQIEGNLDAIRQNTKQTTRENQRLASLRNRRAQSVEQIRTQRQAYEAAAAELDRTARQIQKLIAQLEAKRKEAAPVPYTGEFAKGRGSLDWPVRGKVVSNFGIETHPRFGTVVRNDGIDIEAGAGTPVRAVGKGRVDFTSDDFGSFGQVIVLNHGDGFYTLYGHLSDILVSNGQEVQSGQTIGRVGDTGTSLKGTVLHFEVRKGASALDPQDWLK